MVSCERTSVLTRPIQRVVLGIMLGLGMLLVAASPASAHANLVRTVPSQGQHFAAGSGPRTVSVTFNEEVHATDRSLVVYDGTGKAVSKSSVHGSAFIATVRVSVPSLAEGTYVSVWRILSDDGHDERGAFTFTVGTASAVANINALVGQGGLGTVGTDLAWLARLVGYLAALVLVGGLLATTWWFPGVAARPGVLRLLRVAAAASALAALATIYFEAASIGGSLASGFSGDALSTVLSARFGLGPLVRGALSLGALVLLWRRPPGGAHGRRLVVGAGAFGLVLLATYPWAGHGWGGRWPVLGTVADFVHLGALALWIGGLGVLAVTLRGSGDADAASSAVQRFSPLALGAVAAVAFSGVLQSLRQVGSLDALVHTSTGRLVLIKVLVVLAIVIVAAASRSAVTRLRASDDPDHTRSLSEVRRSVLIEVILAVVVLGLTSTIASSAPAYEQQSAKRAAQATVQRSSAQAGGLRFTVALQPGLVGANTMAISVTRQDPSRFLPATLSGTLRCPGTKPATLRVSPLPDGRWVSAVRFPSTQACRLELLAGDGTSSTRATLSLSVR